MSSPGAENDDARMQDALRFFGFSDREARELPEEYLMVAQRIANAKMRTIGFLPASGSGAVPLVVARLGQALGTISGATVGYVDANLRWPATPVEIAAAAGDEQSAFVTRWLEDSFALLLPRQHGPAGAGVPELRRLIEGSSELFAYLLVDLTGFARFGEHLAAARLVDAIVVVAYAHIDTAGQLLQLQAELEQSRLLGVLLVD